MAENTKRARRVAGQRNVSVADDDPRSRMIDDDYVDNRVRVGTTKPAEVVGKVADPFEQDSSVFKTMGGLSATTKKRAYREFQKVHQGSDGAGSKKIDPESNFFTGYKLLDVMPPPENLDYLAMLYTANDANFAAIGVKVSNIVGLGYDFLDSPVAQDALENADTDEKKTKINKKMRKMRQQMFDWLDSCHEEDDFLETLRNIYIDYESTGNGYMEIGRKANGEVGYIGHIPSTTMRVRRIRDGFVQITGTNKVKFFKHFGKDTADPVGDDPNPNEVIHFKKYNPTNSYYGLPDIVAAAQAVAGNEFAARFNLDYFENKAVPRYVVTVKGAKLGSQSQEDIVNFFETGLRGNNHRTLFVPLPPDRPDEKVDFKMEAVESGTQDSSFANYHKINWNSIFMVHRTPISKATLMEGVPLAAARDADKAFKEGVCRPEQKIFEKKFNRVIATKTDIFKFKLNELALSDEDTQSQIDERYLRMQVLTPNEVRARAGMPGLKGGDKVVDLKPQQQADQKAKATGNKTRDQQRTANATDKKGEGRNAKGDGRTTP
jgi:PBSX family phage portal protein